MRVAGVRAAEARVARAGRARSQVLHLQPLAEDRRLQGAAHVATAMGKSNKIKSQFLQFL